MEAKFNFEEIYKRLDENEKQICDLCRDWNIEECEKCEFISHFVSNKNRRLKMDIVLYTIGCKNCDILEKKLNAKNIEFTRVSDEDTIKAKGFGDSFFPILDVDGVVMNYKTAIQWINNQ